MSFTAYLLASSVMSAEAEVCRRLNRKRARQPCDRVQRLVERSQRLWINQTS